MLCDVMSFHVVQYYSALQSTTPYYKGLRQYYSVLQSTTPVLQSTTPYCSSTTQYYSSTTKYYASTTQYYASTTQYYSSTTKYYASTTQYYASTTQYYKVLRQYYAVLLRTTPVLQSTMPVLRLLQYYSSTTQYYSQYYSVLLQYYSVLLQYYKVLRQYYTVLRQYYTVLLQYYKVLLQYYTVLLQYYTVLLQYYKVLRQYYNARLMKRHLQCAEQQVSPSNLTKYCACHTEWLACLIVVIYETSFTMRGATGVTIQPHQVLHLSRRMTRMLDRRHIWNVIYNARSNRCHHPTSPNTAPATQNCIAKFVTKSLKTDETSFPIRGRSEHDPSMIRAWNRQSATRHATEVTFRAHHEHFLL